VGSVSEVTGIPPQAGMSVSVHQPQRTLSVDSGGAGAGAGAGGTSGTDGARKSSHHPHSQKQRTAKKVKSEGEVLTKKIPPINDSISMSTVIHDHDHKAPGDAATAAAVAHGTPGHVSASTSGKGPHKSGEGHHDPHAHAHTPHTAGESQKHKKKRKKSKTEEAAAKKEDFKNILSELNEEDREVYKALDPDLKIAILNALRAQRLAEQVKKRVHVITYSVIVILPRCLPCWEISP
jgi:hypothetical protein